MIEYPKTLQEFQKQFPTETECRKYLERIRWGERFEFPYCGGELFWIVERSGRRCVGCRSKIALTSGTMFQDAHVSLHDWFNAIWWVTSQKTGVSALGLQRILGIGSYRTAWMLLHKIRSAMVRPGRELLAGEVEVDETFVGGPKPGKRGRGAAGKQLVIIGAERDGKKIGRIRMRRIPDASAPTLEAFIKGHIQLKGKIVTDGWRGYLGLSKIGYSHLPIPGESVGEEELLPRVHRVASLFKRWLLGTHHGRFEAKHLDIYLDEFTFRFNRRTSNARGLLFYRVLENSVKVDPQTYAKIISRKVSPTIQA